MTLVPCPVATWARAYPKSVAILGGDRRIPYAELGDAILHSVAALQGQDVGEGTIVPFLPSGDWQDIVLLWSLWRMRAIAFPVSPRFPQTMCERLVRQAIGTVALESGGMDTMAQLQTFHAYPFFNVASIANRADAGVITVTEPETLHRSQPATILLSSGTAGDPKAVVHELQSHFVSAEGSATNIPIGPGDRWLLSLPIYHVGGLAIVVRSLLAGATLVLNRPSITIAEQVDRDRITHLSVVHTTLQRLLGTNAVRLSTLKAVLLGGGPTSNSILQIAADRNLPVFTSYGLTEMASQVTTTPPGSAPKHWNTGGLLLPGRELKLDDGSEILVRGPTLCRGYLTAGHVQSAMDDQGWFHTGDLGAYDSDGMLQIMGRRDQMFISGGENIQPESVEAAILNLPAVRRALVVPVPDETFGHRPVAFVDADQQSPEYWKRTLLDALPSFMIPDWFFPWPNSTDTGEKPSRRTFQLLAVRLIRS